MHESYRPQVERALQYIAGHLDRPLTVREVARAAYLSEFHFHRIFTAVMGEPVGRFISRRRLETAALLLAYHPEASVGQIALQCGYSSLSNFSKAFSAFFGCSPSRVRRPGAELPPSIGELPGASGKRFDPRALHVLPPEAGEHERREVLARLTAGLRFETREALEVACLASPAGYDLAAIEATWAELITRAQGLGLCDEAVDAYGMAHDSPMLTVAIDHYVHDAPIGGTVAYDILIKLRTRV